MQSKKYKKFALVNPQLNIFLFVYCIPIDHVYVDLPMHL